jgi:trimeric autotransporter adhesin
LGDTIKPVTIGQRPVINLVRDSVAICPGDNVTFTIQNPLAGAVYTWYDAPTGGNLLATGTSYTLTNVNSPTIIYIEAVQGGCSSVGRKRAVVAVLQPLATPVAVVDTAGVNFVRFRWNPVANATAYEVSVNGSATWITPSSGSTGLTHTITGLQPVQTVSLQVRALGLLSCQTSTSQLVRGTSLPDQIYIPNAFTPNGDGRNDVLKIYGYVVDQVQFMIFNQWGEKIFEASSQNSGWDGTYKGKPQPSGVYMYVCKIITRDGKTVIRKGSINLIR